MRIASTANPLTASELVEIYGTGKRIPSVRYDEDEPLMTGDQQSLEEAYDLDSLFPGISHARRLLQSLNDSPPYSPPEAAYVGTRIPQETRAIAASVTEGALDFHKARPMGDIVVKVSRRELLVPPSGANQYYTWEIHEGLTRQTALLIIGLAIMVGVSIFMPEVAHHNRAYHQLAGGQMEWALAACLPFWLAFFLIVRITPARVGRMAALQMLAPVQGFHFMLSHCCDRSEGRHTGGDSSVAFALIQAVATALTENHCNVWLDAYQLVNGEPRHAAAHHAAKTSNYVVLFITQQYMDSVDCCLELLVGLSRPPSHIVVFVDLNSASPSDDSGRCSNRGLTAADSPTSSAAGGAGADARTRLSRVVACLRSRGCTVCTSLKRLVAVLDEVLLSADDAHGHWWRQQPLVMAPRLQQSSASPKVKLCRTKWHSMSLSGCCVRAGAGVGAGLSAGLSAGRRLFLPPGALTSGLHYLSADGRRTGQLFRAPMPTFLAVASTALGLYGCALPIVKGIYPYVSQWQAFTLLLIASQRSLVKCSDCRLYHSSALLPLFLARHEIVSRRARLMFVIDGLPSATSTSGMSSTADGTSGHFDVGALVSFLGTVGVEVHVITWQDFASSATCSGGGDAGSPADSPTLFVFFVSGTESARQYQAFYDRHTHPKQAECGGVEDGTGGGSVIMQGNKVEDGMKGDEEEGEQEEKDDEQRAEVHQMLVVDRASVVTDMRGDAHAQTLLSRLDSFCAVDVGTDRGRCSYNNEAGSSNNQQFARQFFAVLGIKLIGLARGNQQ